MGQVANLPAGSTEADRNMAALALSSRLWGDKAMEQLAATGGNPLAAIERLQAMNVPAKDVEPRGMLDGKRGPKTNKLMQSIRAIGAKISPTMSSEQVDVWIVAMVTALSDLPFAFSTKGAQEAIHVPMKFLNEVEGVIREKAEEAATRHRLAINSLRRFIRQLETANEPALPKPEPKEMTQEDINTMPRPLLDLGLKARYITQEQYDIATRKDDNDAD